jgi:hypothetical protein
MCFVTVAFWFTYRSTSVELTEQLDGDILSEFSELSKQAKWKGIEVVRETIDLRMHDPVGTDNYYSLISGSGEILLSNVPFSSHHLGWFEVRLDTDAPGRPILRSYGDWISGGAYLAVGRDRSNMDRDFEESSFGAL